MPSLRASFHAWDARWFHAIANSNSRSLDATLPVLSRAADRSALWIAIAAALGLSGSRRARRAALRGVISIGASSIATNLAVKFLVRRTRPDRTGLVLRRRHRRMPTSPSFPSGHTASAFAFLTGVAIEWPGLAVPLAPLAAGVGLSRVYGGVHYPTDVAVGALIGSSVALAARAVWPFTELESAAVRPASLHPDSMPGPDGEGLTIVVNTAAGPALSKGPVDALREGLPRARIVEIGEGDDLRAALEDAARSGKALGIAGGDGSINAAAEIAHAAGMPLLVIPAGTLNHFGRDLGVLTVDDAIQAVRGGHVVGVDLATIDGRPFLNTASFGAYPDLVDAREAIEGRIGKWPALMVALIQVLRRHEPVEVEVDGRCLRVWMAFIGNCRYEPSGFLAKSRPRLDDGWLDIRLVESKGRSPRARVIALVVWGRITRRSHLLEMRAREVRIESVDGGLRLARDGETFDGSASFVVTKAPTPLAVFAQPAHEVAPTAEPTIPAPTIPAPTIPAPNRGQARFMNHPSPNMNPRSATTPPAVSHGPAFS